MLATSYPHPYFLLLLFALPTTWCDVTWTPSVGTEMTGSTIQAASIKPLSTLQPSASTNSSTAQQTTSTSNPAYNSLYNQYCLPCQNLSTFATGVACFDNAWQQYCMTTCGPALQSELTTVGVSLTSFGAEMAFDYDYHLQAAVYSFGCMLTMNATFQALLLHRHCDNILGFTRAAVITNMGSAFINLQWDLFTTMRLAVLAYSPVSLAFTLLSVLVLRRLAKENSELHCLIVLKAEVAVQFIAFIMTIANMNGIIGLIAAPFCYISPQSAYLEFNGYMSMSYGGFLWQPYSAYQAELKLFIVVDRFLALFYPVWYYKKMTHKVVNAAFTIVTLLHISTVIAVYTYIAMTDQTLIGGEETYQIAGLIFSIVTASAFVVQVILSILLAIRLSRQRKVGVKQHSDAAKTRAALNSMFARMILSTVAINVVWYTAAICNGIFNVCNVLCMSEQLVEEMAYVTNVFVFTTGLISDLNSALSFAFQCVFSPTYRKALKKVFNVRVEGTTMVATSGADTAGTLFTKRTAAMASKA